LTQFRLPIRHVLDLLFEMRSAQYQLVVERVADVMQGIWIKVVAEKFAVGVHPYRGFSIQRQLQRARGQNGICGPSDSASQRLLPASLPPFAPLLSQRL
jgi:hypothetical protein